MDTTDDILRQHTILVAGGTGFIGQFLLQYLANNHYSVVVLSRSAHQVSLPSQQNSIRFVQWNPADPHADTWRTALDSADAVINLSGAGVFDKRWTTQRKEELLTSRTASTARLVSAMAKAQRKPDVFISASAIGYYGDGGDTVLDETSPTGDDVLAHICCAWEAEAQKTLSLGVRVAMPRIGIVLHPKSGALERMLIPFRLGLGGALGSGKQWFPWIHIRDAVAGLAYPLHQAYRTPNHVREECLQGAYNLTAPHPVTMQEFAQTLGHILRRPSYMPVPAFALRLALGESAQYLLQGQRSTTQKLQSAGFMFEYQNLLPALTDLLV